MFPTSDNVTLLHFTKANPANLTQPIQVAFSVLDGQGREMIITGECPPAELYRLYRENNWLSKTSQIKAVEKPTTVKGSVTTIRGVRRGARHARTTPAIAQTG